MVDGVRPMSVRIAQHSNPRARMRLQIIEFALAAEKRVLV
jgi:hypothetical protein